MIIFIKISNSKLILIVIAILLFLNNIVYSIELPQRAFLRKPFTVNNSEDKQRIMYIMEDEGLRRFLEEYTVLSTPQFIEKYIAVRGNEKMIFGERFLELKKKLASKFSYLIVNGRLDMDGVQRLTASDRDLLRDYVDKIVIPDLINSISIAMLKNLAMIRQKNIPPQERFRSEESRILKWVYTEIRGVKSFSDKEFEDWILELTKIKRVQGYDTLEKAIKQRFYIFNKEIRLDDLMKGLTNIIERLEIEKELLFEYISNDRFVLFYGRRWEHYKQENIFCFEMNGCNFLPSLYALYIGRGNASKEELSVYEVLYHTTALGRIREGRNLKRLKLPYILDTRIFKEYFTLLTGEGTDTDIDEKGVNQYIENRIGLDVGQDGIALRGYLNSYPSVVDKKLLGVNIDLSSFISDVSILSNVGAFLPKSSKWIGLLVVLAANFNFINEFKDEDKNSSMFGLKLAEHFSYQPLLSHNISLAIVLTCLKGDTNGITGFDWERCEHILKFLNTDIDKILKDLVLKKIKDGLRGTVITIEANKDEMPADFINTIKDKRDVIIQGDIIKFKVKFDNLETFIEGCLESIKNQYGSGSEKEFSIRFWNCVFSYLLINQTQLLKDIDKEIFSLLQQNVIPLLGKLLEEELLFEPFQPIEALNDNEYMRVFPRGVAIRESVRLGFLQLEDLDQDLTWLEENIKKVSPLDKDGYSELCQRFYLISDIAGVIFRDRIVYEKDILRLKGEISQEEKRFLQRLLEISFRSWINKISDGQFRAGCVLYKKNQWKDETKRELHDFLVNYILQRVMHRDIRDNLSLQEAEGILNQSHDQIGENIRDTLGPGFWPFKMDDFNVDGLSVPVPGLKNKLFCFLGFNLTGGDIFIDGKLDGFVLDIESGVAIIGNLSAVIPYFVVGNVSEEEIYGKPVYEVRNLQSTPNMPPNQAFFITPQFYILRDRCLNSLRGNYGRVNLFYHVLFKLVSEMQREAYRKDLGLSLLLTPEEKLKMQDLLEDEYMELIKRMVINREKAAKSEEFKKSEEEYTRTRGDVDKDKFLMLVKGGLTFLQTFEYIKDIERDSPQKAKRLVLNMCNFMLDINQGNEIFNKEETWELLPLLLKCIYYRGRSVVIDWKRFENLPVILGKRPPDEIGDNFLKSDEERYKEIFDNEDIELVRLYKDTLCDVLVQLIPSILKPTPLNKIAGKINEKYFATNKQIELVLDGFVKKGWMVQSFEEYSLEPLFCEEVRKGYLNKLMKYIDSSLLLPNEGEIMYKVIADNGKEWVATGEGVYKVDIDFLFKAVEDVIGIFKVKTGKNGNILIGEANYILGKDYEEKEVFIIRNGEEISFYLAETKEEIFTDIIEKIRIISPPERLKKGVIRLPVFPDSIAIREPEEMRYIIADEKGNLFPIDKLSQSFYALGRQYANKEIRVFVKDKTFWAFAYDENSGYGDIIFSDSINGFMKINPETKLENNVIRKPLFIGNPELENIIRDIDINYGIGFTQETILDRDTLFYEADIMPIEKILDGNVWGIFKVKISPEGVLQIGEFSKCAYRFDKNRVEFTDKEMLLFAQGDSFGVYLGNDLIFSHSVKSLKEIVFNEPIKSEIQISREVLPNFKGIIIKGATQGQLDKIQTALGEIGKMSKDTLGLLNNKIGILVEEKVKGTGVRDNIILINSELLEEVSVIGLMARMINLLWREEKNVLSLTQMQLETIKSCLSINLDLINKLNLNIESEITNIEAKDKIAEIRSKINTLMERTEVMNKIMNHLKEIKAFNDKKYKKRFKLEETQIALAKVLEDNKPRKFIESGDLNSQDIEWVIKLIKKTKGTPTISGVCMLYDLDLIPRQDGKFDIADRPLLRETQPKVIVIFHEGDMECYKEDGSFVTQEYVNSALEINAFEETYNVQIIDKIKFKSLDEIDNIIKKTSGILKSLSQDNKIRDSLEIIDKPGLKIKGFYQFILDFIWEVLGEESLNDKKTASFLFSILNNVVCEQLVEEDIATNERLGEYLNKIVLPICRKWKEEIKRESGEKFLANELKNVKNLVDYIRGNITIDTRGVTLLMSQERQNLGLFGIDFDTLRPILEFYNVLDLNALPSDAGIVILEQPSSVKVTEEIREKGKAGQGGYEILQKIFTDGCNLFSKAGDLGIAENVKTAFNYLLGRYNGQELEDAIKSLEFISQLLIRLKDKEVDIGEALENGNKDNDWADFVVKISENVYKGRINLRSVTGQRKYGHGQARFQIVLFNKDEQFFNEEDELLRFAIDFDNVRQETHIHIVNRIGKNISLDHGRFFSITLNVSEQFDKFIHEMHKNWFEPLIGKVFDNGKGYGNRKVRIDI